MVPPTIGTSSRRTDQCYQQRTSIIHVTGVTTKVRVLAGDLL
jgi:hypothetical protein